VNFYKNRKQKREVLWNRALSSLPRGPDQDSSSYTALYSLCPNFLLENVRTRSFGKHVNGASTIRSVNGPWCETRFGRFSEFNSKDPSTFFFLPFVQYINASPDFVISDFNAIGYL
jgi:hypothetical protein